MTEKDRVIKIAKDRERFASILNYLGNAEQASVESVTENEDGSVSAFVVTHLGNGYDVTVAVRPPSF